MAKVINNQHNELVVSSGEKKLYTIEELCEIRGKKKTAMYDELRKLKIKPSKLVKNKAGRQTKLYDLSTVENLINLREVEEAEKKRIIDKHVSKLNYDEKLVATSEGLEQISNDAIETGDVTKVMQIALKEIETLYKVIDKNKDKIYDYNSLKLKNDELEEENVILKNDNIRKNCIIFYNKISKLVNKNIFTLSDGTMDFKKAYNKVYNFICNEYGLDYDKMKSNKEKGYITAEYMFFKNLDLKEVYLKVKKYLKEEEC